MCVHPQISPYLLHVLLRCVVHLLIHEMAREWLPDLHREVLGYPLHEMRSEVLGDFQHEADEEVRCALPSPSPRLLLRLSGRKPRLTLRRNEAGASGWQRLGCRSPPWRSGRVRPAGSPSACGAIGRGEARGLSPFCAWAQRAQKKGADRKKNVPDHGRREAKRDDASRESSLLCAECCVKGGKLRATLVVATDIS